MDHHDQQKKLHAATIASKLAWMTLYYAVALVLGFLIVFCGGVVMYLLGIE